MQVRNVPISTLVFDPTNVRQHDEKNLEAIQNSLEKFGQRKPIVVAKSNTGDTVVVAGNGTLKAAQTLGWKTIDVVDIPADWTADQIKAFAIADNRTAELASWDDQLLASSLIELDAVGWDLRELGFEALQPPTEEDWSGAMDGISQERQPLQQMSFTLHDEQVEKVKEAIAKAKAMGEFIDTGNPNGNGNALARIVETFLGVVE